MSKDLTELEAVVLGWIRLRQPVTPYAVRRALEDSPNGHFSGSAGAVYPLMRRLERRGLLRSVEANSGKRPARAYRITREGTAALRHWLDLPMDPSEMFNHDPIRVRWIVLATMPRKAWGPWFERAEACVREQLRQAEAYREQVRDTGILGEIAYDHARRSLRATLAWLRASRQRLGV